MTTENIIDTISLSLSLSLSLSFPIYWNARKIVSEWLLFNANSAVFIKEKEQRLVGSESE
jgi:hypothetical protein